MNLEENNQDNINIRSYIISILEIWWVFPISIALTFAVAYFKISKSPLEFKAESTILIREDIKSKSGSADEIMTGFGLFDSQKKIENEMAILTSYSLSEKTIKSRGHYVRYYKEKKFRSDNIYLNSPFFVMIDSLKPQLTGTYQVVMNGEDLIITRIKGDGVYYDYLAFDKLKNGDTKLEFSFKVKYNEWIENEYLRMKFVKNPKSNASDFIEGEPYFFRLYDVNSLSRHLNNSINAESINKNADVILVKLHHDNAKEAVDLLNSLTNQYFLDNLNEKNQIAGRTIDFIDSQLISLSDSLFQTESLLEAFRKDNQVINVEIQSKSVIENDVRYETALAMAQLKMKYFEYLKSYINDAADFSDILVPSIMDVNDLILSKLIQDLLEVNSQKNQILSNSTPSNPLLLPINKQIQNLKKAILQSVNSLIASTNIEIVEVKSQVARNNIELNKIPETERKLIGIQRDFTINNEMYTFLLQKRAESSIAQASNVPDGKLVDEARANLIVQTKPNKQPVYIFFLIVGVLLPIIFIVLKKVIFDFIEDKQDILKMIDIPIIGSIPHSDLKTNFIIRDYPNTFHAESFRSIRTNLQFMLDNQKSNVLLITSSVSKEGKTFLSVNIALVIAASSKKTILVGLDMRSPGLSYDFYPENNVGMSTYLTGQSTIENTIQKTEDSFMDIITAGPIPPNPSELIGNNRMKDLIQFLRSHYDYIVIDTPPINLTTDALQVIMEVDAVLFVVRYGFTQQRFLENLKTLHLQKQIKNSSIIFNDLNLSRYKGYGYGYGYGNKTKKTKHFNKYMNALKGLIKK